MTKMVLNTPPQVEQAYTAFNKLEKLKIGESISFQPPLSTLVTHALYLLLKNVDKAWRITPAIDPNLGWWGRLKAAFNQPVDLAGHPIPQIIAEIQRNKIAMKITVTQKHINEGLRGNCQKDPIALAMREAGLDPVWVGPTFIEWGANSSALTPHEVYKFMIDFDNQVRVFPFEFRLEG